MSDVLTAHLAAIEANLSLVRVQIEAMRHAIAMQAPQKKAEPVRPPRCQDISPALCAMVEDEARLDKRSFGAPNAWECRGCGHVGNMPETAG